MSDKWKAYDCLQNVGYILLTVNQYSLYVVDLGAEVWNVQRTLRQLPKEVDEASAL